VLAMKAFGNTAVKVNVSFTEPMKTIIAANAKESHCPTKKQMQGRTILEYKAGGPKADLWLHFAERPFHSHRHI